MNERVLKLINTIENWNVWDLNTLNETGELTFNSSNPLIQREKIIRELKEILEKF